MDDRLYIGVDPSGKKPDHFKSEKVKPTGNIGLCITKGEDILYFDAVSFFEFQKVVEKYLEYNTIAVVENPDGLGAYERNLKGKRRDTQLTSLGKNQFCSNLCSSWLKHVGCQVFELTPKQKGKKWSIQIFEQITGMKIKKRQDHAIDAYQMIQKIKTMRRYYS